MVLPGLINLDFADIRAVMTEMGKAMMGTGEAKAKTARDGRRRGRHFQPAARRRIDEGRRALLINITGGDDMTLFELDEAANRIRDEVDPEANIIVGAAFDRTMAGCMRIPSWRPASKPKPRPSRGRRALASSPAVDAW